MTRPTITIGVQPNTKLLRIERVARDLGTSAGIGEFVEFLRADSARALCRPRAGNGG